MKPAVYCGELAHSADKTKVMAVLPCISQVISDHGIIISDHQKEDQTTEHGQKL